MTDLISRQAAIDAMATWEWQELYLPIHFKQLLEDLPSVQPEKDAWDIFNLITSAYHGKQYYFKEEYELVYSRASHKTMTFDDALREFLGEVSV